VLLFGSQDEIARRLAKLRKTDLSEGIPLDSDDVDEQTSSPTLDFEMYFGSDPAIQQLLHTLVPPEMPKSLSPGQAAQIGELLHYIHLRLRSLLESVKKTRTDRVTLDQRQWQNLLDLQDRLAGYLRGLGEPRE